MNYPVMYNNVYLSTQDYHRSLISNFNQVLSRRGSKYILSKFGKNSEESPFREALRSFKTKINMQKEFKAKKSKRHFTLFKRN